MMDPELSSYPAEMAGALRHHWAAGGHPAEALPGDPWLAVLLDGMYQASLMREEGQSVKCRIIVALPEAFADGFRGAGDPVVLRFTQAGAFTPHAVRKLAAAAGYYRALLAIEASATEAPVIWGMVITGTKWVNRFGSDRFEETTLPPNLVLQILAPGHLIAAFGYTRVLESAGGKLLTEGFDPFGSTWLPERFSPLRASLLAELKETLRESGSSRLCDFFVRDVAQSVIRRVLGLVRTRGHGGMLVYLPESVPGHGALADHWFRFRVRFTEERSSLWFRTLLGRVIERVLEVGGGLGLPVCTWNDYRQMHDAELTELDDALIGFGHFLADLMSVDGALVLDRSLRLVGFGGEILGDSHVLQIHRACDLEAERLIVEPADTAGTRHRSAYRLVNGTGDAIAIVVSQDGEVRFVAQHNGKLTYWPYLP